MDIVNQISSELTPKDLPKFKSGDNITVFTIKRKQTKYSLKEMLFKEKVWVLKPLLLEKFHIQLVWKGYFQLTPTIEKIEINKKGRVRRARIFYLRKLQGKKARIKEVR